MPVISDVLVIGCGISGCVTALQLAETGVKVTLITRAKTPNESNTYYAQGGIIYRSPDDSPDLLIQDLLKAGAHYNNPKAIKVLAEEGPELVKQILIDKVNVNFDRTEEGDLSLIKEGAHSTSRILHSADTTGKTIEIALLNAIKGHKNIRLLTAHTAIDLLTLSHHSKNREAIYDPQTCIGAFVLDQEKGEVIRCMAQYTVLATGGLGQIFLRTSNPAGARGDGLAMAYRSGARVINCEFVQFHPTTFHHPNAPNFLISEAVRGAGAKLVDVHGNQFMSKYSPVWKDLAPRDIVARSIHQEMLEQGISNVYLDLQSYMKPSVIKKRFPEIYKNCLGFGVDISTELIPVVPAAHYFCGGVWVDEWGETTIKNLFAVGEVACTGVHGANRLGSASLLEGLVWGARSADRISSLLKTTNDFGHIEISPWKFSGEIPPDLALIQQDMSSIQHILWNYVGLVRTSSRLERALSELRNLESQVERFYRTTRVTDSLIGLRNAVLAAILISRAAWANRQSVGCHYRED